MIGKRYESYNKPLKGCGDEYLTLDGSIGQCGDGIIFCPICKKKKLALSEDSNGI